MGPFREPHSRAILAFTALLIAACPVSLRLAVSAPPPVTEPAPKPWDGTCENYLISPYDSLVKIYADSAGLDWRLVSAVIYHESLFDTAAVSHRGAVGLMQLMPETAASLGTEHLSDPVESIRAGTAYLKRMHYNYRGLAENGVERLKFMLAAYNAGAGRIRDCINYARYRGVDPSRWENVAEVIPEMDSDDMLQLDTLKFGRFNGAETISYVRNVMDRYERYCRRVPR